MVSHSFTPLLIALVSAGLSNAWFRVACTTPLVTERIDPIVSPGLVGSNHVHTGEESFNSMTSSNLTQSFTKFTDPAVRATLLFFNRVCIDCSPFKGFGANSTYEDLVSASCTSCEVQPQVSAVCYFIFERGLTGLVRITQTIVSNADYATSIVLSCRRVP